VPVVEDATHVESATVHIAELTFDAAFAAAASTTGKTERHLCLKLSSIDGLCMYGCMFVFNLFKKNVDVDIDSKYVVFFVCD
jgi:hypothetical protein